MRFFGRRATFALDYELGDSNSGPIAKVLMYLLRHGVSGTLELDLVDVPPVSPPPDVQRARTMLEEQNAGRGAVATDPSRPTWKYAVRMAPWAISAQFFTVEGSQIEFVDGGSVIVRLRGRDAGRFAQEMGQYWGSFFAI